MASDIICPNEMNIDKMIVSAKSLGFSRLYIVGDFNLKLLSERFRIELLKATIGEKGSGLKLVMSSSKNRHYIEKTKADVVFDCGFNEKKDFMHQRASGLNHIILDIANRKGKKIGYSLSSMKTLSAEYFGRIMQNVGLCRKYKVQVIVFSFATDEIELRSPKDIISLCRSLGFDSKQSHDALEY